MRVVIALVAIFATISPELAEARAEIERLQEAKRRAAFGLAQAQTRMPSTISALSVALNVSGAPAGWSRS